MRHHTCDPARRWSCVGILALYVLAIAAAVWLVAAMCGCSPTRYVPVESVRTEYRDRDVERTITDTVRDTRFVWIKGDTVIDWRDRWHTQREYVHDTCYIEHIDTIRLPYPVERELTRWEQAKMDLGGMALGGVAAVLAAVVVWLIKIKRRK